MADHCRVYIVEKYHYQSQTQRLPARHHHGVYESVTAANDAAACLFQALMQEQFPNLGYLETVGIDERNGLFRGAILLKQKRHYSEIDRLGVQVRTDLAVPYPVPNASPVIKVLECPAFGMSSKRKRLSTSCDSPSKHARIEMPMGAFERRRRSTSILSYGGDAMAVDERPALMQMQQVY